ncbi:hypothetical protein EDD11_007273 [Mortierella claussenii]|nr:hypothetical protein EDD11_007273 [Mortierella claussenii]
MGPSPDIQCEDVWSHNDRCGFVEQYCGDYPAGLINYLHFYFCDLSRVPALAVILLTGVTFLAFGNGSPDVFSTFSAIGAGSGSLAIGELVGAASFITSVVVGSMAIIKPFKVSRAPFLRDVSFFAGCVLFTLYAVMDGKITFVESILLVAYYIFYVSFVVFGNWWHQRVKSERELEERARNMFEDDEDEEGQNRDDEEFVMDEEQALLRGQGGARDRRGSKPLSISTQLMTGPYDAYEDDEHDVGYISPEQLSVIDVHDSKQTLVGSYGSNDVNSSLSRHHPPLPSLDHSGGVEDSISLRPPGSSSRPAFKRRASLLSAIEFNDVVRSLTLSGSRGRIASYDPSYYGPKSPRSPRVHRTQSTRTLSDHRHHPNHSQILDHITRSSSPLTPAFNLDYPQHQQCSHSPLLEVTDEDNRNTLSVSPVPMETEQDFDSHFREALLRQSLIMPDHHDPSNQHLGHIHHYSSAPCASSTQQPGLASHQQQHLSPFKIQALISKMNQFLDVVKPVKPIYFPTLLDWEQKSHFVRFLAVTSIPMVLLLTLTLPVVELCEVDEDEDDSRSMASSQGRGHGQGVEAMGHNNGDLTRPPKIMIEDGKFEPYHKYDGWSRTATTVQMLLAPIFVATVVTSAAQEGYIAIVGATVLGAGLSFLVHRFSTEEEPPRLYGALCFMGFLVAITWIFLVANEVVGILQAFGMIFGLSDAILGLTIFAMGNSLGDLVANITIAKMGFPRMAFSACFGGPLLNMLLGVGISGTYMTVKTGTHIPLKVSPTLFVSLIGVLLTLLAAVVVVPRNGYMMTRSWGWFLLAIYLLGTLVNVVIEITTSSKDH